MGFIVVYVVRVLFRGSIVIAIVIIFKYAVWREGGLVWFSCPSWVLFTTLAHPEHLAETMVA